MKNIITVSMLVGFTASCGSPPKVEMPNGNKRIPINDPVTEQNYELLMERGIETAKQQEIIKAKMVAMQSELAVLKELVRAAEIEQAMADAAAKDTSIKASPTDTVIHVGASRSQSKPDSKTESTTEKAKSVSLSNERTSDFQIMRNGVIFRVRHPIANTDFAPNDAMKRQILEAAKTGDDIKIKGRTDAVTFNAVNRKIAIERAVKAHQFLVSNGVPASKIKVMFLSAGDHVADNQTIQGSAQNRRVEIWISGNQRVASL